MSQTKEQIVAAIRMQERRLNELYKEARQSGLHVFLLTGYSLGGELHANISEPDIKGKQYD